MLMIVGCATVEEKSGDVMEEKVTEENAMEEKTSESMEKIVVEDVMEENVSDTARIIEVTAKRYEFIPNTIVVKEGEKITLIITSIDATHGIDFEMPFLSRNVQLPKNEAVEVKFTASEKGEWDFRCSVFCGPGHSTMKGRLVVE